MTDLAARRSEFFGDFCVAVTKGSEQRFEHPEDTRVIEFGFGFAVGHSREVVECEVVADSGMLGEDHARFRKEQMLELKTHVRSGRLIGGALEVGANDASTSTVDRVVEPIDTDVFEGIGPDKLSKMVIGDEGASLQLTHDGSRYRVDVLFGQEADGLAASHMEPADLDLAADQFYRPQQQRR